MSDITTVYVTGGAGYVGSALIPRLLKDGYKVRVLDLYLYGDDIFGDAHDNPNLTEIKGDLRDQKLLARTIPGSDALIHLACISNDPSFELNPNLGKSINFDAFEPLVTIAKNAGVRRFIYASSSSVYGVKEVSNVTEDLPLEPLTDYSKFKAMCEEVLLKHCSAGFAGLTIRPATVCGYAKRQRLDVVVNLLTNHAVNNRKIKILGGDQMRPNLHIQDMVELYVQTLRWPAEKINRKIYNAGYHNHTVREIAQMVRKNVGGDIAVEVVPTDDNRSYHISSAKIQKELGFSAAHTIEDAIRDLVAAFKDGRLPDSMTDSRYFNIKKMQEVKLS